MALSYPFIFLDENVRVGFGMDPDDKLNKANCLQPAKEQLQITNCKLLLNTRNCFVFSLFNKH